MGDADGAVAGDEAAGCRGRGRARRRRGGRGIPSCRARRRAWPSGQRPSTSWPRTETLVAGAAGRWACAEVGEAVLQRGAGPGRARRLGEQAPDRRQRAAAAAELETARASAGAGASAGPPPAPRGFRRSKSTTSARSKSVRATVVTGIPAHGRHVLRTQLAAMEPDAHRAASTLAPAVGAVTSISRRAGSASPRAPRRCRWLSTAPSPQASTAAIQRPRRLTRRCPTAYTSRCSGCSRPHLQPRLDRLRHRTRAPAAAGERQPRAAASAELAASSPLRRASPRPPTGRV